MAFRIANTFTDSLAKLTGGEQKANRRSSYDLHVAWWRFRQAVLQPHSGQGQELRSAMGVLYRRGEEQSVR
jgi:hypothetical protein